MALPNSRSPEEQDVALTLQWGTRYSPSNKAVSVPVPGGGGRGVGAIDGLVLGDAVVGLEDGDEEGLDEGDFEGLGVPPSEMPETRNVITGPEALISVILAPVCTTLPPL